MSEAPPPKRPRTDRGVHGLDAGTTISTGASAGVEDEPARTLPRSAVSEIAVLLAEHSALARSLISADEDAVEAALTCCTTLVREHGGRLDAAVDAVTLLADLANCEEISWRDLPQLREQPLAAALVGCDQDSTQRLHTISEMLQFPKRVSLLLLRQLAVFRIRVAAAAGENDTAALVRAEPVLAPLLEQAEDLVMAHVGSLPLYDSSAFWHGFFADPEDVESLDFCRRELAHVVYGAGRLLSGRGLLPDLLTTPLASCARTCSVLAEVAAVTGDTAALAALQHAGYDMAPQRCTNAAACVGHVHVLQLAVTNGWDFWAPACARVAACKSFDVGSRRRVLSFLRQRDPSCAGRALRFLAGAGHVECVQWLLEDGDLSPESKTSALEAAAFGGHIPVMQLLLERGATLSPAAFRASANVATLQWCAERGCSVDETFVKCAVAGSTPFQLEWATSVTDITAFFTAELFEIAASTGEMASVEWLHARGCPWDSRVLGYAARPRPCFSFALRNGLPLGGVDLIDHLVQMPLPALTQAVQALHDGGRGHLLSFAELFHAAKAHCIVEIAEWLVCDQGLPVAAEDCAGWWCSEHRHLGYQAAAEGRLRLLQHLCDAGLYTPGPADMRAGAVHCLGSRSLRLRGWPVDVVRWLHSRGIPAHGPAAASETEFWPRPHHPAIDAPDFMTFHAARSGALELLQELVGECGAPLAEPACAAAAEEGHIEVLRWALSKHCPCGVDTWCAAVRCAGNEWDNYRPLHFLHAMKRPWSEAVWAAAAPYEEVRAWLKVRGCPGSQAASGEGAGVAADACAGAGASLA